MSLIPGLPTYVGVPPPLAISVCLLVVAWGAYLEWLDDGSKIKFYAGVHAFNSHFDCTLKFPSRITMPGASTWKDNLEWLKSPAGRAQMQEKMTDWFRTHHMPPMINENDVLRIMGFTDPSQVDPSLRAAVSNAMRDASTRTLVAAHLASPPLIVQFPRLPPPRRSHQLLQPVDPFASSSDSSLMSRFGPPLLPMPPVLGAGALSNLDEVRFGALSGGVGMPLGGAGMMGSSSVREFSESSGATEYVPTHYTGDLGGARSEFPTASRETGEAAIRAVEWVIGDPFGNVAAYEAGDCT